MSTLTGIVVDVSYSMKNSVGDGVNVEGGSWARSIFKVVNELIKHDVSSSNQTFALAVGSPSHPEVFDLLSTVGKPQKEHLKEQWSIEYLRSERSKESLIHEALTILERNGAPYVRIWAKMDVLLKVVDAATAAEILYFLKKSSEFTKKFVSECLPIVCLGLVPFIRSLFVSVFRPRERRDCSVNEGALFRLLNLQESGTEDSVRKAIEKGKKLVVETMKTLEIVGVSKAAIKSVRNASEILHASIEQSFILDLQSRKTKEEMIDEALFILEANGASRVRIWGKMDVLLEVIDDTTVAGILHHLKRSSEFTNKFVKFLPEECRELSLEKESVYLMAGLIGSEMQRSATKESVKEVVKKSNQLIAASTTNQELTDEEVDMLLKAVEPYVYGRTPLIQAIRDSVDLFSYPEFANHQKLLFILSDGEPDDESSPPIQELSDLKVTTVSCFITNRGLSDPRRLYSILDENWEEPAKFMFTMSSTIKTQKIPRTLFVKRGWKIDIDNNETRLFFQVNHPDIIKDVCDMAKNGVLSQDALSDILSSVDLDIYVNQASEGFGAKEQDEATCYANASAAVLHLAMKRIIERDGGYPDFFELRRKLIAKYGQRGASTIEVLNEVCPTYRLQCQKVDAIDAMKAISAKRPVVARFYLTGAQWDQFSQFYKENPKGILTRSYLDLKHHSTSDPGGHAVVLMSYDAESLRLMNSWGDDWADNGFFRVQNSDVLRLEFVDVFWTVDNLSRKEKRAYDQHGTEVAAKLMRSLKGIQVAKFKCPLCAVESKVVDFSGQLLKAKCPKCRGTFNANKAGGDLALNLYLMSLTH